MPSRPDTPSAVTTPEQESPPATGSSEPVGAMQPDPSNGQGDSPCAIGDYAIIGDCRSAALISRQGSLDWLCWPCFDSPSIFGAILDTKKGGRWQICPAAPYKTSRTYVGPTNVLKTRFTTESGVLVLTDFMPVATEEHKRTRLSADHQIIRMLECVSGEVAVNVTYAPRPQYGSRDAKFIDKGKLGLRVDAGRGMLTLHSNLDFNLAAGTACATRLMRAGETVTMVLTYSQESPEVLPVLDESRVSLQRTTNWWLDWAGQCSYKGPYAQAVLRSALTLKLLEFPSTGAFIAAVTTSLPEQLGGKLNWDYRYCWLRDASLIIGALCGTGFANEAEAFAEWMLHATRLTQPKLMVMYDIFGNLAKPEKKLEHLAGYADSQPVQIGNSARAQVQLDTYGEVICGASHIIKSKGAVVDRETSKVLVGFGKYVCKHWMEPDAGIWEPRGEPAVHTHSRLLCWVALDELLKMDEKGLLRKVPVELFRSTRDAIRRDIELHSWNDDLQSYTSEPGKQALDATLLMMALHNFEQPDTSRLQGTYKRVQEKLGAGNGLFYRNRAAGEPEEGAFGICSFWAVEFLAMGGGSIEEANDAFKSLLGYANDLGLYAEEIDPSSGAALGNFPQAFTHVGLINAAIAIDKRERMANSKPEKEIR